MYIIIYFWHALTDKKRQKERGPFSCLRSAHFPSASTAPRTVPGARLSARAPRGAHILPLPRPPGSGGLSSPHTRRHRLGVRWPPLPAQGPDLLCTHPSREWTPASSRWGRGRLAGSTGTGDQREPDRPPLACGPGLRGGSRRKAALRDLRQDKADKDRRRTFEHGCGKRSHQPAGAGRYTQRFYSGQLRWEPAAVTLPRPRC